MLSQVRHLQLCMKDRILLTSWQPFKSWPRSRKKATCENISSCQQSQLGGSSTCSICWRSCENPWSSMCLCLQSSCPCTSAPMEVQFLTRYTPAALCGCWESHRGKMGETLECWNFLCTGFQQECAPSTAFWIKVNIHVINSLIHLTPGSYWYQRTAVGKELTRWCWITQDLGLSQFTLHIGNWEYLLLQTSAPCCMRLYYVQWGHSGTLSDAIYIFALTDLQGQSMKSMAAKKKCFFSLSTGTCCHRRLQKQMLCMDIKAWTV